MATVEEIAPLDTDPDIEEKKEEHAESEDDIKDKKNLEHSSGSNDAEPWTMLDKVEPESDRKDENKDEGICTSDKGQDVQHTSLASEVHDEGKDVSSGGNEAINEEKVDVIEEREALTYETEITGEEKEAISEKIETVKEEKEDISENTGSTIENTGDISEEKEPVSDDEGPIVEKKEDICENTEAISEESGDISEEKDDTCEEKEIIIDTSENISKGTGTVNAEEQTIIEESKAISEEKEVISENIEAVSDDSKDAMEENGTISGKIETICVNNVVISEVLGNINEEKGEAYKEMEDIGENERDGIEELQDHKDLDDDNELNGNSDNSQEYNKESCLQDSKDTGLEVNKIDTLAPCDVGQEEEILSQVHEYEENDTSNYFLSGLMVVLIAIVIGLSMGHFLGLIVSLITNMSPGFLGLGPDPEAGPNYGLGVNPSDYNNGDINPSDHNNGDINPSDHNNGDINPSDYNNADIDQNIELEDDPSEYYSNGFIDPNTGLGDDPAEYNVKEDVDHNIGLGGDPSEYVSRGDMNPNIGLGNDLSDHQTAEIDAQINSDAVMNEINEADIAGHADSMSGALEKEVSVEAADENGISVEMAGEADVELTDGVELTDDSGVEMTDDSGVSTFHCMGLDDQPIMVGGFPAVVKDPVDCHQYFNMAHNVDTADYVETADNGETADKADTAQDEHVVPNAHDQPPETFVSAAKNVFKSADQATDERVVRKLWNQNGHLRTQIKNLKSTEDEQGEGAIKVLLTENTVIKKQVDKLRITEAEPAQNQKKTNTHSPSQQKKTSKDTAHTVHHQKHVEEDEDDDDEKQEDGNDDEEEEEEEKDNEGKTHVQFINYLSGVIGDIVKNIVKEDQINFKEAKRLVESLKVNAGKFDKMAHSYELKKHVSETHKVTVDFGKGLVEAVKKLSEGGRKPKESEFNKFKYQLEKHWKNTEETYKRIIEDITTEENEVKNVLEFTEYLSGVIGNIVNNIVQEGQVNFKEAKRLVESLKENAGKFDKMAHTNKMKKQVSEIQKVTANFGKGLVEAVKKLSEDGRKPKESDLNKFKYQLEKNWRSTEETYKKIIKDITGNDKYKNKTTNKYEHKDITANDKYEDKNTNKYEHKDKQRKEQKHFRETKKNVEYKYKDSKHEFEHRRNEDDDDDEKDNDNYKNQKNKYEKKKGGEYRKESFTKDGKQQNFRKKKYD